MTQRPGFFQLQWPPDLLVKLESDFTSRVSPNPFDTYAAFDFFVTAESLRNWLRSGRYGYGGPKTPHGRALETICKQLANGAKHFTPQPDDAIDHTAVWTPARSGAGRVGAMRLGDATGHLFVHLAPKEAKALRRATFSTVELASMVLGYWQAHRAIANARQMQRDASTP